MKRKRSMLEVGYAGELKEESTAFAGAGLLAEAFRQSGAPTMAEQALPKKRSSKGLRQWEMVESFVLLSALGGECLDDMARLRDDEGLAILLGYKPPAPETARQWLDRFHDEGLMSERPAQGSFLPAESRGLEGLREVNRRVVHAYVEAQKPGKEVTLDVDAHLVETAKTNAEYCYEGYKAYQPMVVCWGETGLVLRDEFREGNVPPTQMNRRSWPMSTPSPRACPEPAEGWALRSIPMSGKLTTTCCAPMQLSVTALKSGHGMMMAMGCVRCTPTQLKGCGQLCATFCAPFVESTSAIWEAMSPCVSLESITSVSHLSLSPPWLPCTSS